MFADIIKVSVDDTDPQFQWNGPWFTTQDFVDDIGNGSPFLNTLHGISSNGSLTFSYYGGNVSLWGSLTLRNTTLGPDPYWRCLLDGSEIQHPWELPGNSYSHYLLCAEKPPVGNHTLQLIAMIQSETLYIDQVRYKVPAGTNIGNAWTEISSNDARFNYSAGWITGEGQDGPGKWTNTLGAWLTCDFNGTSVIWRAYTPRNSRVGPGIGQYQIDGGKLETFVIPPTAKNRNNQAYFNVTGLRPGPHRLTVMNAGNESTTALGINYITAKNSAEMTSGGRSGKVIGAAVGGSIGAVLLAVLGVLAIIWYRRRKRQREHDASSMGGTTWGSPTQGPWGQPAGFLPYQYSVIPQDGAHSSPAFVAPSGPHQSPTSPNPPTNFAPPSSDRPVMFVTPLHSRLQQGPSAFGGIPSPIPFAGASNGSQSPAPYTASATKSSPRSPPFTNTNGPTAIGTQQNVWPGQVLVQHVQDGKY
ncbi:hypothetical protein EST38_g12143 [Candolleomyces aberdarensis]|uniref:Uncharacterized protein n=1 Tax=Candolleomyces aberdarensis TaxID=2316362 RepID=A0A4V1Q235_9AGAR|nr:hypothetical protein EST38_g12143 [Candolleomyces aberdarensis]